MNSPVIPGVPAVTERQTERQTCGRCGGTGKYPSSCYNGLCLGCSGKGFKFTARGVATEKYLKELRSKPVESLQVGDVIRVEHFTLNALIYSFDKITVLEPHTAENADMWTAGPAGEKIVQPGFKLVTHSDRRGDLSTVIAPGTLVRVAQTAEQKAATLAQALAYQDTLTKAGKPRKNKTSSNGLPK